jgi:Protein of unknown function (DUF3052)
VSLGYSGTPLAKKLGLKPGMSVALLHAPPHLPQLLGELPDGVMITKRLTERLNLVLSFFHRAGDLASDLPALRSAIAPDGMLWVAWPKRVSGSPTDITEDVIRQVALPSGLVDVKVCAIDQTWSGLKLVIRKELRESNR